MFRTFALFLITLSVTAALAESKLNISTVGAQTPECLRAAYKVAYIEARVGMPANHAIVVACSAEAYKQVLKNHGQSFESDPYGFTDTKAVKTYLNAESVLRSEPGIMDHGGVRVKFDNFGEFAIAHEIGHLATSSPLEWRADAWAAEALKKYVKVSFEEFRASQKTGA